MFPEAEDTDGKTRPEIYAMGFRNPFRFSVDPNTGWIGLADYAPDSGTDAPATRGPAGIVEYNLIKQPGNYGWPLCMGNSEPFRDVDYKTSPVTVGPFFDCANPVNDSILNTGRTNLPPAQAPVMYYGYTKSSVPAVIPAGGGLAPMGGPFYDYDPALASDVKFPEYFDGKPFFYEWSKNRIYSMTLDDEGTKLEKIYRFLPTESFLSPQDMKFGPDGALYTLEWGGGFGRDNPNSGIYRVDYINGSRSPIASATATPDNGQEPLTVSFDGTGSRDPEGGALSYAWDFDGNGTVDATTADRDVHVHDARRLQRAAHGHRSRRQVRHHGAAGHRRQHAPAGALRRARERRLHRLGRRGRLGRRRDRPRRRTSTRRT